MDERIVIFGDDWEYLERLAEGLARMDGLSLVPCLAETEEEAALLLKDPDVSGLLLEGRAAVGRFQEMEAVKIVLTEVPGDPDGAEAHTVYKYQDLKEIAFRIREALLRTTQKTERGGLSGARYIGVMSPVGRTLKTGFCLTAGRLLSQREKTLLISFEAFSGFSVLFGRPFERGLSDLLYAQETGTGPDGLKDTVFSFHGLDVLPPAAAPEDLYGTAPGKIRRLVGEIAEAGAYRKIVLDLAADLRLAAGVLPLMDRIYVPVRSDPMSAGKTAEFRDWLGRVLGQEGPPVQEILLPDVREGPDPREFTERLLWSGLGAFVRELLEDGG